MSLRLWRPPARSAREMRRTCEVPVLPPISMPGRPRAAARAVPRAPCTTSRMPRSTMSSEAWRHADRGRRRRRPARRAAEPRRDGAAAIGQPRRHHRQLQRRRQHEALADAADQRLALLPALAAASPSSRRWSGSARAARRAGRCRARGRGRSGWPWRRWRRCRPGAPARRSRRRRTGPAPGPCAIRPWPCSFQQWNAGRAQAHVAGAEHLDGRRDAGLERRQRGHHLEGRARRVLAADAFVDQRRARVVAQLAPDALAQAGR